MALGPNETITGDKGAVDQLAQMRLALGFMDNAVETAPRSIDGSYSVISGRVNLSYVTAYRTQAITQLGACTRSTAVVGLTSVRFGLYEVTPNGDLTLVARTAQLGSASNAYSSTFFEYTSPLDSTGGYTSSVTLEAGKRYAFAQLCVFTTTAPNLRASASSIPANTAARPPRLNGALNGQTDLPASIPAASIGNDGNAVYMFGLA